VERLSAHEYRPRTGGFRALLDDLSQELAARGARAELFLVGGAALAVAYDATRATRDLDAVFVPSDVVRQAAIAVAGREGLADDWLNDAVKGFLPGRTRTHSASMPVTR
jgi:Nucleotidyltransferase of unknown function (DUF6036)